MKPMYKLLTVDFWDTLIRRNCHPDSSKLASAYRIAHAYHELLRDGYKDYFDIYRERCLIEAELVKRRSSGKGDGEYVISEVLGILLERILGSPGSATNVIVEELVEFELDFELRHTYPDKDIAEIIAEYPAERRYFVSDFYMPSTSLMRILSHHRIQNLVDGGISSCDVGLNKRSGRLFRYAHELFGVEPGQHVHIGDNVLADIKPSRCLGVEAVHFEPEPEHSVASRKLNFLSNRRALFLNITEEIDSLLEAEVERLPEKQRAAFQLGARAAPLFVGFMLNVAEQALKQGLPRLYFFTREGEFFIQVWSALFQEGRLHGTRLPAVDTLEVSRISTFSASLREVSILEMRRIWSLYSTQTLLALIKSLNLEPEEYSQICARHGLDLNEPVTHPWRDSRVRELFKDEDFTNKIQKSVEAYRACLFGYLNGKGLHADLNEVGIVDIGWRGTIQDNLAILHPSLKIHGYYLGLQRFLNEQPLNCIKQAYGQNANLSIDDLNLLDAVSVVEMLCNSPNGSVLGWSIGDDGRYEPKRLLDNGENKVFEEFTRYFQIGAVSASRIWGNYIDQYVVSSDELRPHALNIWKGLVVRPDSVIVDAHASLNHNEIFGVGGFVNKSDAPRISDLFVGLFSRKVRGRVVLFISQTQWPAGIWGRGDLSLHHKVILVSVVRMALFYKRVRSLSFHGFFW